MNTTNCHKPGRTTNRFNPAPAQMARLGNEHFNVHKRMRSIGCGKSWLWLVFLIVLVAEPAWAAAIIGLFNTGVNSAGTPLPDNGIDPHYRLVGGSAVTGQAIVATSANSYPVAPYGPWLGDDAVSAWATPSASAMGPNAPDGSANYWYETSFDLTGMDPATALITGHWATDNGGMDILINGVSTGQVNTKQFSDFTYFQINSGFVSGINTLTFVLNNGAGVGPGDGFTGLRVEMTGAAEKLELLPFRLDVRHLDDGHALLTWPVSEPAPILREIVILPPVTCWTPVTNPVVRVGDQMTVTVEFTGGSRFFSLKTPLRSRAIFPKPNETVADTNKVDARQIVLKFHEGTHVRLRSGALTFEPRNLTCDERDLLTRVSLTPDQIKADLVQVKQLLQQDPARSILRMLEGTEEEQLARNKAEGEAMSGEELADLDLYYYLLLPLPDAATAASLINALNQLQSIEIAYAQPLLKVGGCKDKLPTTTFVLTPSQGYLTNAPGGIDANYAWKYPGGRGAGVRVIDVEGGWFLAHEDLPERQFFQAGTILQDDQFLEHGTAVLGELVSCENEFGTTGIVTEADYGVSSFQTVGFFTAGVPAAVNNAAGALRAGDVIVIELHAAGPSSGLTCACNCGQFEFVPMENWQADFDAIRTATARGIVVVEIAGNGSMNLDGLQYQGRFLRVVRDSGAIMVGAGIPGTRSPECWSNFGSRVDVQGWGEGVATLGFGDLRAHPTDPLQFYTQLFNGTSSATPIVAGAACAIQGVRRAKGLPVLSPLAMRSLLRSTGTRQPFSSIATNIGRLPDLRNALNAFLPQTACFVSQSVPTNMIAGETYPVTIAMRNCGRTTWTPASLHLLGSQNPQDNVNWGLGRVSVPGSIAPGQLAVFNFQVTAPLQGTYNFQWRMVQENVEWFGDCTPNLAIKVWRAFP